ncbi:MAG TPA: HEAT repeat domain-containing protein [Planctomycetota bacterium]
MMTLMWIHLCAVQEDPARLIEWLRSGDVEQRESATRKLKDLGERAVAELQKAADDPDQEVAGRVRFLLRRASVAAKIGDALRQAVPGVEDRLAAGDHAWTQVWMDLARRGEDELAPRLLEPLAAPGVRGARTENEKMWVCRTAASQAYGSAGIEIVRLLDDPSERVKSAAMQALIELRSPEAVPLLLQKIKDGPEESRPQAEQLLVMMAASVPLPKLIELLKSESPRLRVAGVRALGGAGQESDDAATAVLPALGDTDAGVRAAALAVVAGFRKRDTAPRLLPLLRDPVAVVRQEAARALGALGAREQAVEIRPLLADAEPAVRVAAVAALSELGDAAAAGAIAVLVRDPQDLVRREAARALVDLGATDSAASLRPLLKDNSDELRLLAVWALGHLRALDAAPEIEALLGHAEPAFRASAAAALGRAGAATAVPALLKALGDKNGLVRACAAESLGRLGGAFDHVGLLVALADPNAAVRAAAARALAALDAREAAPLLLLMLEDESDVDDAEDDEIDHLEKFEDCPELETRYDRILGPVRGAAAEGLVRMGFREGVAVLVAVADDDYESVTLTPLNQFRRPEEVARLGRTPLAADLTGTPLDRLKKIAAAAGLEIKLEDLEEDDVVRPLPPLKADGVRTLWDALRDTAETSGLDVIVDRRRLRVAEDLEAVEFWTSWWETEKEE